jgi:hypothetical protein
MKDGGTSTTRKKRYLKSRCHEHPTPIHGYFYSMAEIGTVKFPMDHQIFEKITTGSAISMKQLANTYACHRGIRL